MMLTKKGRLGLMIMMRLALREGNGFVPLAVLADELETSPFAMRQPIVALRKSGLIHGERGWNGGYALARPAASICLAEIVGAIDRPANAVEDGRETLYGIWDDIGDLLHDFLSRMDLDAVVRGVAEWPADASTVRHRAGGVSCV